MKISLIRVYAPFTREAKSAADQTRTDDPLVNSQLSSRGVFQTTLELLYHAELQRRNIASILGQIKCCVGLTETILQLSERTNSPGYNSDESN